MKFFYSDTFNLPLPTGHRFPGGKYTMLRERLLHDLRSTLALVVGHEILCRLF